MDRRQQLAMEEEKFHSSHLESKKIKRKERSNQPEQAEGLLAKGLMSG
jgi:hypothetical protein